MLYIYYNVICLLLIYVKFEMPVMFITVSVIGSWLQGSSSFNRSPSYPQEKPLNIVIG